MGPVVLTQSVNLRVDPRVAKLLIIIMGVIATSRPPSA